MRRRIKTRLRAVAVVEFAVVTPLLVTMLLGIMEYGYLFMVRQTMQHAAREACRIAVLQTTVEPYTEVSGRVADIMSTTGLTGYSISMTHAAGANPYEVVEVTIPLQSVSIVGGYIPHSSGDLLGSCSMRKEGFTPTE